MAEDKKNQIEEPLQDEQLNEVSGGGLPLVMPKCCEEDDSKSSDNSFLSQL